MAEIKAAESSGIMETSPAPPAPNTYQMKPNLDETFKTLQVKEIIQTVLNETLTGQTYSVSDASKWTKYLADEISLRIKDLNMNKYKYVVQVTMGQQLGAGCKYIARCRWDAECDSHVSAQFTNASIFCIASVFGLYLY